MATLDQRLAAAIQLHQAGRLREAEMLYRGILREAPREPHALHLLGVLAHQAGRCQEASHLIGLALAAIGPHPVFHSNLAAVYLDLGRLDEAAHHGREAIRLDPALADAHNNLGVALRRQGRFAEAANAFRAAIGANPRHVDARANLGAVLSRQGWYDEAWTHLREAVRLKPAHAEAHNSLAGLYAALDQQEPAIAHLRQAIRLNPRLASAHSNLGLALDRLHQTEEAMQCFQEALRLAPGYATAHVNVAAVLKNQGRVDEALAAFQEGLRLEPDNAVALFGLSRLAAAGHYRFTADDIRHIQDLLDRDYLTLESRMRLHFALAGIHDHAGAYDDAFMNLRRANELCQELCRRRGQAFDPTAHTWLVDRLIATCTPAYFERVRSFGLETDLPIFIVGMPRSGTTLVEQILASHPQVHGAGELHEIEALVAQIPQGSYPDCLAKLDVQMAEACADQYVRKLGQLGGSAIRVVDKLPFNYLHLGLIAALLPRARIIHCRRDPIDTCVSCYFQNFAENSPFTPYTLDLGYLGEYYRGYERLMAHWRAVLPLSLCEVQYEEMTANQEAVSRRLVDFCGLPWDDACLRYYDNRRLVRTFSTLQVRQPIYRGSVGRWKRYAAHLEPLLHALGMTRK